MSDDTPSQKQEEPKEEKRELIPIPVFDAHPKKAPKFMVVGDDFVGQTTEGEVVTTLRIPQRLIQSLEGLDTEQQLLFLLEHRGEQATLDLLPELDVIDYRELVRKYWQAFHEKEEARVGESFRSSAS